MSEQYLVDLPEFFVEVQHTRGNFSLFEIQDPFEDTWHEIDVWDYRRADMSWWIQGYNLEEDAKMEAISDDEEFVKAIRVTRYPELEENILDIPYHPSVDSSYIKIDEVRAFFEAAIE